MRAPRLVARACTCTKADLVSRLKWSGSENAKEIMAAGARKGTAELLKNAVVHNASTRHSATVIFLHGLGDTG